MGTLPHKGQRDISNQVLTDNLLYPHYGSLCYFHCISDVIISFRKPYLLSGLAQLSVILLSLGTMTRRFHPGNIYLVNNFRPQARSSFPSPHDCFTIMPITEFAILEALPLYAANPAPIHTFLADVARDQEA